MAKKRKRRPGKNPTKGKLKVIRSLKDLEDALKGFPDELTVENILAYRRARRAGKKARPR